MARQLRIEYPGAFYHVTSRGNEQKEIFKSKKDRDQFLHYLETARERYGAVIHSYCLMNNHYHLLLETPKGNLSQVTVGKRVRSPEFRGERRLFFIAEQHLRNNISKIYQQAAFIQAQRLVCMLLLFEYAKRVSYFKTSGTAKMG